MSKRDEKRLQVVLLGPADQPRVRSYSQRLLPEIEKYAEVVLIDLGFSHDLSAISADLAIVLGGDGSILRAGKQMGCRQIPVLGVNLGKLGFLAHISPDELVQYLPDLRDGLYQVTEHLMFECQVTRDSEVVASCMGLNETAIIGGPPYSLLDVDLYVDSELVTTYSCDGLIVSTPVGSTAHSLSAGGPILRQELQAFVISPISPHTLTVRPVVDSADRVYEMEVRQPNRDTTVVVDGQHLHVMYANDRVRVCRSNSKFKLVAVSDHGYYRALREKLGWGGTIRHKS